MASRPAGAGGPADLRRLPNALAGRRLGPAFGTMSDLRQPHLLRMILVRKVCNFSGIMRVGALRAEGRTERAVPPQRRRGQPRPRPARAASTMATASRNGRIYTGMPGAGQVHPAPLGPTPARPRATFG